MFANRQKKQREKKKNFTENQIAGVTENVFTIYKEDKVRKNMFTVSQTRSSQTTNVY